MSNYTDQLVNYVESARQALIRSCPPKQGDPLDEAKFAALAEEMRTGPFEGLYVAALAEHLKTPAMHDRLEELRSAWISAVAGLWTPLSGELPKLVRAAIFELPIRLRPVARFNAASQIATSFEQDMPAQQQNSKPDDDEGDDPNETPKDGPQKGLLFRWDGITYPVSVNPYRLLVAMWGKNDVSRGDVEELVYGHDSAPDESALPMAIHHLNTAITGSGWSLHRRRGEGKLFWKKPENFSSVSQLKPN